MASLPFCPSSSSCNSPSLQARPLWCVGGLVLLCFLPLMQHGSCTDAHPGNPGAGMQITGAIIVPGGVGGTLLGGWLSKRWQLTGPGQAQLTAIVAVMAAASMSVRERVPLPASRFPRCETPPSHERVLSAALKMFDPARCHAPLVGQCFVGVGLRAQVPPPLHAHCHDDWGHMLYACAGLCTALSNALSGGHQPRVRSIRVPHRRLGVHVQRRMHMQHHRRVLPGMRFVLAGPSADIAGYIGNVILEL